MTDRLPDRLRNVDAVAAYLGISVSGVYRLLRKKRLTGSKVCGQWRVSDEALVQFLEDNINVPKQ